MNRITTSLPDAPLRGLRSGVGLALALGLALAAGGCGGGEEPKDVAAAVVDEPAAPAEPAEQPAAEADPFPGPPEVARPDPHLPEVRDLPRKYRELHAMLTSSEVLMEWKAEIVQDDLAPDPSSAATKVLMLASLNDSIPISMAALKALSERADDPDVGSHLVWMLDDPRWERRAWAARVLGQEGNDEVVSALEARLGRESENRVRAQLEAAIESLRSHTAETRPGVGEAGG